MSHVPTSVSEDGAKVQTYLDIATEKVAELTKIGSELTKTGSELTKTSIEISTKPPPSIGGAPKIGAAALLGGWPRRREAALLGVAGG